MGRARARRSPPGSTEHLLWLARRTGCLAGPQSAARAGCRGAGRAGSLQAEQGCRRRITKALSPPAHPSDRGAAQPTSSEAGPGGAAQAGTHSEVAVACSGGRTLASCLCRDVVPSRVRAIVASASGRAGESESTRAPTWSCRAGDWPVFCLLLLLNRPFGDHPTRLSLSLFLVFRGWPRGVAGREEGACAGAVVLHCLRTACEWGVCVCVCVCVCVNVIFCTGWLLPSWAPVRGRPSFKRLRARARARLTRFFPRWRVNDTCVCTCARVRTRARRAFACGLGSFLWACA